MAEAGVDFRPTVIRFEIMDALGEAPPLRKSALVGVEVAIGIDGSIATDVEAGVDEDTRTPTFNRPLTITQSGATRPNFSATPAFLVSERAAIGRSGPFKRVSLVLTTNEPSLAEGYRNEAAI